MRTGAGIPHDFAAYARTRWPQLVVTARLLTDDLPAARDLALRTLIRVHASWRRVPRNDVDFHVRRLLVRTALRGRWSRGRRGVRQRAVLVLRYWEGLTDKQIAQLLGTSGGAVRHIAGRGLKAHGGDARRLRETYAAVAADVPAAPLPLETVRARGRVVRRRRVAVVAVCCAAVLVPGSLFAAGRIGGAGAGASSGAAAGRSGGSVRIVAPGERVEVAPGVQTWLTADGGHWSTPEQPDEFRGLDAYPRHRPGVSMQAEMAKGRYVLSGLYYGVTGDPGRVALNTGHGEVAAQVLTLAGSPGWGVWYASTSLSVRDTKVFFAEGMEKNTEGVRVYDAAGAVVARLRSDWWRA
ncbi:hypothetical protein SRB17_61060 [Streptomyces sp. RB17]|uniref:sigma factor-like helix-turn-helix DNA-binding protein n=1 Tax=Streptomyces sp. RB17 TaxID=2585197 RepID=UPI00129514DE|nr:sigma factor-like helix-turn-helix DNA-binding protein [Streptomyces sp. RB17]MQY38098.1 hypothetical protein [Streptomyces sp. RB17]